MTKNEKIEKLNKEKEILAYKLLACGVAARQNTKKTSKERLATNSIHWSVAYLDICNAVDREIELRSNLEKIKTIINEEEE